MTTAIRNVLLAVIVGAGLFLRLRGVAYDLPFTYDPDESLFVSTAVGMLQRGDPNPRWFGAPAITTAYGLSAAYTATYLTGRLLNQFRTADDFRLQYQRDPSLFYLEGRVLNVIAGDLSVLLVWWIGRFFVPDGAALVAASALAVSPLHVALSQNLRMDVLLTFFLLGAFGLTVLALRRGLGREWFFAGALSGLAMITKWPAVIFGPFLLGASLSRRQNRARSFGFAALGCAAGSVAIAPWLLLNWRQVILDVTHEARPLHLSHTGNGLAANLAWYFTGPLPGAVTVVGLSLAFLGVATCLARPGQQRWLLATFPVAYGIGIASLSLRWDRWVLPVVPFALLNASVALSELKTRLAAVRPQLKRLAVPAGAMLVGGMLAPLCIRTWRHGESLLQPNSSTEARGWALDNLPPGSLVLVERYAPHLPFARFRLFFVDDSGEIVRAQPPGARENFGARGTIGKLAQMDSLAGKGIRFVILSDLADRYLAEQETYPHEAAIYRQLLKAGKPVYDRMPTPERRGPRIRVLDLGEPSGEKAR